MGSTIIINDTLQITKGQGFPAELDIGKHKQNPYKWEDFKNRVFEFQGKDGIRTYQAPPVRVFLVENIEGKWVYWGLCHVLETKIDMVNKITSGKFRIIKIFSSEEMKRAFDLVDNRPEINFFK